MGEYIPLQQQAYNYIKNLIEEGKLETGKFYSEKKIAADMKISRTPVRDAILRLSQDHYIDIVPSKGFQMHIMTEKDIWDTFEVRTAVEGFCAIQLKTRSAEKEGKNMLRLLKHDLIDMRDALEENESYDVILDYDFSFHRKMVYFSENKDFISLFNSYNHLLSDIARKSFEQEGRPWEAYKEHEEIYKNLISGEEGSETALYRSVWRHMEASRNIALDLMKKEKENSAGSRG